MTPPFLQQLFRTAGRILQQYFRRLARRQALLGVHIPKRPRHSPHLGLARPVRLARRAASKHHKRRVGKIPRFGQPPFHGRRRCGQGRRLGGHFARRLAQRPASGGPHGRSGPKSRQARCPAYRHALGRGRQVVARAVHELIQVARRAVANLIFQRGAGAFGHPHSPERHGERRDRAAQRAQPRPERQGGRVAQSPPRGHNQLIDQAQVFQIAGRQYIRQFAPCRQAGNRILQTIAEQIVRGRRRRGRPLLQLFRRRQPRLQKRPRPIRLKPFHARRVLHLRPPRGQGRLSPPPHPGDGAFQRFIIQGFALVEQAVPAQILHHARVQPGRGLRPTAPVRRQSQVQAHIVQARYRQRAALSGVGQGHARLPRAQTAVQTRGQNFVFRRSPALTASLIHAPQQRHGPGVGKLRLVGRLVRLTLPGRHKLPRPLAQIRGVQAFAPQRGGSVLPRPLEKIQGGPHVLRVLFGLTPGHFPRDLRPRRIPRRGVGQGVRTGQGRPFLSLRTGKVRHVDQNVRHLFPNGSPCRPGFGPSRDAAGFPAPETPQI